MVKADSLLLLWVFKSCILIISALGKSETKKYINAAVKDQVASGRQPSSVFIPANKGLSNYDSLSVVMTRMIVSLY